MDVGLAVLALVLLLLLSALFSGSETGMYSVSRAMLDAEAARGRWTPRLLRRLLRKDAGFLVTLLIGNNLMLELLTHRAELHVLSLGVPPWAREIMVALLLTPIVFFFGELLPKDQFHRRPQRLLLVATPFLAVARVLFLPLAWPIDALSRGLERLLGLESREVTRALRREEMLAVLQEGTRTGALAPRAESLARNVLVLRETPVSKLMVPWSRVRTLDLDVPRQARREAAEPSEFSRLPVVTRQDGSEAVVGYVHLLDYLGGELPLSECLRPLPELAPDVAVDRALARLRVSGQRLALVGTPEAPQGLVTLMDLVEAISRQSRD